MKAEISHHGFLNEARYSGVYLQQGTMITDRDWNAMCDRLKRRIDVVGDHTGGTGVPREDGVLAGFAKSGTASWTAQFAETGGWICADGLFARAEPATSEKPFAFDNQADLPDAKALDDPAFVYADIWEQVVTAFADGDLFDPGLHGAHTCFVTKTLVQIKRCAKEHVKETQCGLVPDAAAMPAIGDGRFGVSLRVGGSGPDNCDPCAEAVNITRNVGNYLFRIEVHDVVYDSDGVPQSVTLKWSSENGAVQYLRPAGPQDTPIDYAPDYAFEFFNSGMDMLAGIPPMGYGDQPVRGTLVHEDPESTDTALTRVRRWDGYGEFDLAAGKLVGGWDRGADLTDTGTPGTHGLVTHKDGVFTLNLDQLVVTVEIGPDPDSGVRHAVLAGDHWLALARTRAEETERIRALSELPVGIRHHYCVLGECSDDGTTFKGLAPADKRRLDFPVLPCLDAGDVRYDPDQCDYAKSEHVSDVKEALDAFCKRLQPPYHALRMSQGTGQEGPLGDTLPGPVEVVVEDQDGAPVSDVRVTFSTLAPLQGGQTVDRLFEVPPVNPRRAVTVTSDANGRARAFLQLNAKTGLHTVEARLADPVDGRPAVSVVFAALGIEEEEPQSDFPLVKDIQWANDNAFENDAQVRFESLLSGFRIMFSEPMMRPPLTSSDTVILTAEVPNRVSLRTQPPIPVLFDPHIICGLIVDSEDDVIHFKPDPRSLALLSELLSQQELNPDQLPECAPPEGIRFRIRLLGRFTLSMRKQPADAFVPGIPDNSGQRIALDLAHPGLGHASDFEAWFYLDPKRLRSDNRLDLNKATLVEIRALPGISAATARRIFASRDFTKLDDLVERGILTRAQLEGIADKVTV